MIQVYFFREKKSKSEGKICKVLHFVQIKLEKKNHGGFSLFLLQSNFSGALASYEKALSVSAQREVRLLCLHEVGWSYVLLLHWDKSSRAFLQLKRESRWSKSFYCYLSSGKFHYFTICVVVL